MCLMYQLTLAKMFNDFKWLTLQDYALRELRRMDDILNLSVAKAETKSLLHVRRDYKLFYS